VDVDHGGGIVFLIGLLDDLLDLKPVFKIAGEVVAASVVFETESASIPPGA
jgi:hypothetical protein